MRLTMVGQSTVIIELSDGKVLITDPWFKSFHMLRAVDPALRPQDIPNCDIMLVSHKHVDHVDKTALRFAKEKGATVVGSRKAAKMARHAGCNNIIAMKPGDVAEEQGIKIHATSAFHPLAKDAVGFVVEAEKTIYFCGDTRANDSLIAELKQYRLDVALVQVACSVYFGKEDGMNMEEAARLVREVAPGIAIPIHYQVKGKAVDPERFLDLVPPPRGVVLPMGEPVQID